MISAEAAARLAKLIPLLGSDQPGDVVAAANAITKTLTANKLDWHDVARNMAGLPAAGAPRAAPMTAPVADWRSASHAFTGYENAMIKGCLCTIYPVEVDFGDQAWKFIVKGNFMRQKYATAEQAKRACEAFVAISAT